MLEVHLCTLGSLFEMLKVHLYTLGSLFEMLRCMDVHLAIFGSIWNLRGAEVNIWNT